MSEHLFGGFNGITYELCFMLAVYNKSRYPNRTNQVENSVSLQHSIPFMLVKSNG